MGSSYGPWRTWFAWYPVDTDDAGWTWLRIVWRRRQYLDIAGHPAMRFWQHWHRGSAR